jgi:hypothetical protein
VSSVEEGKGSVHTRKLQPLPAIHWRPTTESTRHDDDSANHGACRHTSTLTNICCAGTPGFVVRYSPRSVLVALAISTSCRPCDNFVPGDTIASYENGATFYISRESRRTRDVDHASICTC